MHLKSYLRNNLKQIIQDYEEEIDRVEGGLRSLEQVRMSNARYIVEVKPINDPHEQKSVVAEHRGTIDKAISNAEWHFKIENRTENLDGTEYLVKIVLGRDTYEIPQEYWIQYTQSQRYSAQNQNK